MRKLLSMVLGLAGLLSGCVYYVPMPDQARRPLSAANSSVGLSKEDVLRLTRAGVAEDTIISKIKADGVEAHPSADDVIELTNDGVSEGVIKAMLLARLATAAGPGPRVEATRYYYPSTGWGFYDPYHWDHHDWGHHGDWNHY